MYEASSTLVAPTQTLQPLWRYLSAARLEDLLRSREVFFTNLPALEDPREGALTARTREHLAQWFHKHNASSWQQAYEEVDKYQEQQKAFYVNCWHMNDHESYLMWKAYAERGYAIQTTFERMRSAFDGSPGVVTGGTVSYHDFQRDLTGMGNVFDHVATKDLPYEDEREFRLVLWDVDPRNQARAKVVDGIRVAVDLQMLVRRIVASPFAGPMPPALECLVNQSGIPFVGSNVAVRGALPK